MRAFACGHCGQLVFFENSLCLRCSTPLGFAPWRVDLVTRDADHPDAHGLVQCANAGIAHCNWMLEPGDPGPLCRSCRLTRTRPSEGDAEGLEQFAAAEAAKRRLLFQLLDLGLPVEAGGLQFDLLTSRAGPVVTGHNDGLITIDLAESDDARREQRRAELDEPYRTLLGHFRHEVGHFVWPMLVGRAGDHALEACRELFGDERADYGAALERHYANGAPPDWNERHVSAYATSHPWEDWAETFAHYLHIRDALQTAAAFRLFVAGPRETADPALVAAPAAEPERPPFETLIGDWLPLTYALNAVNRSMGRDDLYPFTLAPTVIDKLSFVHERVSTVGTPAAAGRRPGR
ncbi:MAG TPA: putative zinc-binding metallopeptidase [Solirubrobacteraceae bacterium]